VSPAAAKWEVPIFLHMANLIIENKKYHLRKRIEMKKDRTTHTLKVLNGTSVPSRSYTDFNLFS
ncbi:hypothetical protein AB0D13_42175, partial [Streptomyces sp. NPDC048430]|uniref:hypothetical protein n=1 Tax=Streptomyces sp. NPDC048430 TaxID=3155388 RepID=UPI003412A471